MKTNIHTKLFKLQSEIGAISKDSKNPFYKSKYFDINSLIGQLKPLLDKHQLLLLQPITNNYVRSIIIGSAITYFRRYTLQSLLALQAIDDDGNLASKSKPLNNPIHKPLLLDNSPELKNAIKGMSKGASLDDVKKIYKITPYIQEKLLNFKI